MQKEQSKVKTKVKAKSLLERTSHKPLIAVEETENIFRPKTSFNLIRKETSTLLQ